MTCFRVKLLVESCAFFLTSSGRRGQCREWYRRAAGVCELPAETSSWCLQVNRRLLVGALKVSRMLELKGCKNPRSRVFYGL
jgi:hypothetical protein